MDYWSPILEVLPIPKIPMVLPMFIYSSFRVSSLKFRSLIQLELVFLRSDRYGSNFVLLCVDIWFSYYHSLKMLSFFHHHMFMKFMVNAKQLEEDKCSSLGLWFCSIDLHTCFVAKATLFWLLWLYSVSSDL